MTTSMVHGSYHSPSGRTGTFTGSYRLERLLTQFGHPAATGVFTGELVDADRSHVGHGSRRHTAAVQVRDTAAGLVLRLGPVDVNLHGFLVTMDEVEVYVGEQPEPAPLPITGQG